MAEGDKIPRKGGPGITRSDLLVINKTDLAPAVGADLAVMDRDARRMRGDGPFVFAQVTGGTGAFKGATGTVTIGKGEKSAPNTYLVHVPHAINIHGRGTVA